MCHILEFSWLPVPIKMCFVCCLTGGSALPPPCNIGKLWQAILFFGGGQWRERNCTSASYYMFCEIFIYNTSLSTFEYPERQTMLAVIPKKAQKVQHCWKSHSQSRVESGFPLCLEETCATFFLSQPHAGCLWWWEPLDCAVVAGLESLSHQGHACWQGIMASGLWRDSSPVSLPVSFGSGDGWYMPSPLWSPQGLWLWDLCPCLWGQYMKSNGFNTLIWNAPTSGVVLRWGPRSVAWLPEEDWVVFHHCRAHADKPAGTAQLDQYHQHALGASHFVISAD